MTEGPRAHAIATLMNNYMIGRPVEFFIAKTRKARIPLEEIHRGRINRAEAYGKNLLVFINDYAIRIHTLIYGILKIYKAGDNYEKPVRQVRLVIRAGDYELVGYNVPIIEIDYADQILKRVLETHGPDPLRPDWNRERFIERLLQKHMEKIGVVLLDQGVIAGIGNILRNEILFRAQISPERLVKDLSKSEVVELIKTIEDTSSMFYHVLLRGEDLKRYYLVYNKSRKPCPRCGTPIKYYRQEPIRRKTFMCPSCQR